jgi:hypothetical protein
MQQLTVGAKSGLYALDCGQLWYQRNAILWAAGYCFHALRAVRVFEMPRAVMTTCTNAFNGS